MAKENQSAVLNLQFDRMGIGGYVAACPSPDEKHLNMESKLPKANSMYKCLCGQEHKVVHRRTKHFSHYL